MLPFIECKQQAAYDSINRTYLYEILKDFVIRTKSVNLIKITLKDLKGIVKTEGQLAEVFGTARRLAQGNALSTALFGVVLEIVIRNIETNPTGTIFRQNETVNSTCS